MIIGFNYRLKIAKIQSTDRTQTWTAPLGRLHLGKAYPDLGTLLMYRKCNPSDFQADIQAMRDHIAAWPDFEEKDSLLEVCDKRITLQAEERAIILEAALREAYGIIHGTIISRGIHRGKLTNHKNVITHVHVVDLVNYLVEHMPYFASSIFPSPKSKIAVARTAQQSQTWRKHVKKLNELTQNATSFEIFTAFRVASYLEKVTMPRTNSRPSSGAHQLRFALNHPTKKGD